MNKIKIVLIIASSIDGRIAFPYDREKHLGSIEDKKILNEALQNVDATIFGSGTLKAHKSTFLVKECLEKQSSNISSNQPISIIAGDIKNFSNNWLYFNQPVKRWLVSSNNSKEIKNFNFERQFFFRGSWKKTLEDISKEGIRSIGLLGGSQLINSFNEEHLIDEIKITIVPNIIGGKFSWIPYIHEKNKYKTSNNWLIKSFKVLDTNEIFIHYAREKRD